MIPKRLHYVWVGSKLPDKQRAFIDSWRATNPDYEIICWNEDNIDLKLPQIAREYARRRWATVADIARLIAIHSHGGIYLDTDFRVYRPLDRLLEHRCFFAFQHEFHATDWICNGAFGAEPGHPFVAKALDAVLRLRPNWLGLDRVTKSGPKLITRLLREDGLQHYSPQGVQVNDVFVCPKTYFFPFSYDQEFRDDCITSETLAAHFWEKSWEKDIPRPVRWAKAVRRMLPKLP
jgi:mannosyltransferase OCH1-like enzyme